MLRLPRRAGAPVATDCLPPAALECPQTPDKAIRQDGVDDLLASMGF